MSHDGMRYIVNTRSVSAPQTLTSSSLLELELLDLPIGELHANTENEQKIFHALSVMLTQVGVNNAREKQRLELAQFRQKSAQEKQSSMRETVALLKATKPYSDRHARFKTWKKYLCSTQYVGPAHIAYAYWANKHHTAADIESSRENLTSLFTTYPTNFHLLSPRELAQVISELQAIKKYIVALFSIQVDMSEEFQNELTAIKQKIDLLLKNEIADAALQLKKHDFRDPSRLINLCWDSAFALRPYNHTQDTVGFIPADEFFPTQTQSIDDSSVLTYVNQFLQNCETEIVEDAKLREAQEPRGVVTILQEFVARYATTTEISRLAQTRQALEMAQIKRNAAQQELAVSDVFKTLGLQTDAEKKTIVAPEHADRFVELSNADPHAMMRFVEALVNVHWQEHQTSIFWRKNVRMKTLQTLGFVQLELPKIGWIYHRPIAEDFYLTANTILQIADSLKMEKTEDDKTSVRASDLGMLILRAHSAYTQAATSIALAKCRKLKEEVEKALLGAVLIKTKTHTLHQQLQQIGSNIDTAVSFATQTASDFELLLRKQEELTRLGMEIERITGTINTKLNNEADENPESPVQLEGVSASILRLSDEIKALQLKMVAHEENYAKLQHAIAEEIQAKQLEQKEQEDVAAKLTIEVKELAQQIDFLSHKLVVNTTQSLQCQDSALSLLQQKQTAIAHAAETAFTKSQRIQIRLSELNLILGRSRQQESVATTGIRQVLETCSALAAKHEALHQYLHSREQLLAAVKEEVQKEALVAAQLCHKQQTETLSIQLLQSDVESLQAQNEPLRKTVFQATANSAALAIMADEHKQDTLQVHQQVVTLEATLRNQAHNHSISACYYEGLTDRAISHIATIMEMAANKHCGVTCEEVARARAIKKVCEYLYHREITPDIDPDDHSSARCKRDNILALYGNYLSIKSSQSTAATTAQCRLALAQLEDELQRRRIDRWYDFTSAKSWNIYKNFYAAEAQKLSLPPPGSENFSGRNVVTYKMGLA